MARKKSGAGLWWIVGIIVVIVMVPREVWIGLGVLGAIALGIYVFIKWQAGSKAASKAVPTDQPTLAELMSSQNPSRGKAQRLPPRPTAKPGRSAPPADPSSPTMPKHVLPVDRAIALPPAPKPIASPHKLRPDSTFSYGSGTPPATPSHPASPPVPEHVLPVDRGIAPPTAPKSLASAHKPPPNSIFSYGSGTPAATTDPSHIQRSPAEPEFYSARMGTQATSERTFPIPKPAADSGEAYWVRPGETVSIAGLDLPGGMLYVGARLKAANGAGSEPSLISGLLHVAGTGDFRDQHTGYWPSYGDISPQARRAYLKWLAEGRSHPDCDIGLVFLFFYGLERRIILDTSKDPSVKCEWPVIAGELRRLLPIYGERSGSFLRYAGELLNWIELDGVSSNSKLYLEPIPSLPRGYELPAYLKLVLGQSSLDRAPIPAELALAWVRLTPETFLRTAATRCPEEFERLFVQRYREMHGRGLILPKNRTKLKFVYRAASSGFQGATASMGFSDVPDVTALTAPIRTLREIADQCTNELGAFSRLVGKDPAARTSLDGLLQLPATLWPAEAQARIETLKSTMQAGALIRRLDEVIEILGGSSQSVNRDRVRALARALQDVGIGMEPDVLTGARAPNATDPVVLFAMSPSEGTVSDTDAYRTAALTLQLASAVAHADGEISEREASHLRREIEFWNHLTPRSRERLHAHLVWLTVAPMTLASLKKKLEPLEHQAKQAVATFMATLAQADGMISPDEVKFLEKVYKALGVEPKQVFSDIHAVGAGNVPAARTATKGFRLDAARIAELEKDTARVSALLSEIFTEEAVPAPAPPVEVEPTKETGLLGLDEAHTALVRLMLSRAQWSRAELEDAAADLELMLDGALEHVNEACFDAHDIPLSEGEDPIDINPEAIEKIES